jgi:hypothetical protein
MKALPTVKQNARFLMFHYLLWKHTNDPINLQLNTRNEIIDKWIFYCKTYQSIKESIYYLLKQLKKPYKYNFLDDLILTHQTKRLLIEFSHYDIHTHFECTFNELLDAVFYEIQTFDLEKQILAKNRINRELLDGEYYCFTEQISRLVNSLSGLSEKVSIKISDNEEISNIILLANKKYKKIEEIKDYVKKEMKERLYNDSLIEEWLIYIE